MVKVVVIGAINWDISMFVERFPRIGEEVPIREIRRVPGGKGANVAVAAARILGPGKVSLFGALGKDEIAKTQIETLQLEGVDTSGIKFANIESGQAYIIIDELGKNMIHTFFGANLEFFPQDVVEKRRLSLIQESSLITIIDPPFETIKKLVELGKRYGKTIIWDPGVRCALELEALKAAIQNADYLICNEVEIKTLTGISDPIEARNQLAKIHPEIKLIVTLGEKGCVIVSKDKAVKIKGVNLEKLGMKVVNTVGCGDAFIGVFSAAKVEGFGDIEALKRANLAGALKATKWETRGSPAREELEKYLGVLQE